MLFVVDLCFFSVKFFLFLGPILYKFELYQFVMTVKHLWCQWTQPAAKIKFLKYSICDVTKGADISSFSKYQSFNIVLQVAVKKNLSADIKAGILWDL